MRHFVAVGDRRWRSLASARKTLSASPHRVTIQMALGRTHRPMPRMLRWNFTTVFALAAASITALQTRWRLAAWDCERTGGGGSGRGGQSGAGSMRSCIDGNETTP